MIVLVALLSGLSTANPPEPSCLSAFGQTACGYDCKAAFGKVKCSNVPYGTCHAAFGDVVCGPAPIPGAFAVTTWPKAECVSAFGKIACGYACVTGFGEVGCAAAPWGACVAAFGGVTCASGDPSLLWSSARGEPIPQATCISSFGKRACGWNCVAKRGETVCGGSPWAVCDVQLDGRVVCSETPLLVTPAAPR